MKQFFTIILSLALVQAFGQTAALQVVSSAGGYYKDNASGLSISWTLGEPVIATFTSTNLMLTQGFQQGNLFGTAAPKPELPSLSLNMYPNPAINWVKFDLSNAEAKGDFVVEVFEITGRKIIHSNLGQYSDQDTKELSIGSLKSGIYLVKVSIGSYSSEVLKLIKE